MKMYVHEIIDANSNKPLGRVWWDSDKKKVKGSSTAALRAVFEGNSLAGNVNKDVMKKLSSIFKNGYLTAKKVR